MILPNPRIDRLLTSEGIDEFGAQQPWSLMDPVSIGTAVAAPAWASIRALVGRDNIIAGYFDAHGEGFTATNASLSPRAS